MKQKVTKVVFLHAEWDRINETKKRNFYSEIRKFNIPFEVLDVEEVDGLNLSIKHSVRNVPAILFFDKHRKLIAVEKGNEAYRKIQYYL